MIREGTRSGRYPNAADFGRELEVSRPTVMRDLDWLRDEERAPIEYAAAEHGYRMTDATWQMAPVQVSTREVFAFSVARKVLGAFRGTPLELDMASVLEKVGAALEDKVTLDPSALTERFTVLAEDYVRVDPATWTALAGHLDRQERVRIRYRKFSGDTREYVLEPYHLYAYHGNWYVLGKHAGRETPATFAISRVLSIHGTGEHFEVPASFDPRAHLAEAFGITRGEKTMRVRLLFSPSVSTYIRERVWHPTQMMRERRDGALELRMQTAGWKELVRWVLSWQPDVRVLAPASLRQRVREKLRQGMKGQRP